jgi:YVTN family beta-propeller protein
MKILGIVTYLFLICLIFAIGQAQWLETTIYLPDSLTGVVYPQAFTYNVTNNTIYVGGEYGKCIIVIDGATNEKIARIQAGNNIKALCWNSINNKVYSANYDDDNVTIIDGTTNSVITTLSVGSGPCGLSYNPTDSKIYCANEDSSNITIIDGANNSVVTTVTVGSDPYALEYNPTNNKIYCANEGSGTVTIIDGANNSVITTVTVGSDPYALEYNPTNNKIYCANEGSGTVTIIDGSTNAVITTVTVGSYPRALAYNPVNNKVYCTNYDDDNVTIIDGATNSVITTVTVGNSPYDLVYNLTDNKVYCSNYYNANVTIIDGATNTVITTVAVGSGPCALVYNPTNNKIYSANFSGDNVTIIDGTTNTVITTITVESKPRSLVYNPANNKVYCGNSSSDNLTIIDGTTNSVIITDIVGNRPYVLVYNPTNNKVYCANYYSDNVTIIDGTTDSVITTLSMGSDPCALVHNPTNNKVYCANSGSDNVRIINGANDSVITTVTVGSGSCALVYNPANNKVCCANEDSDNMTIIDGATNTVITTVTVGNRPYALVYNPTNNKTYCANRTSNDVTVIDGTTDSVISTVQTGDPYALTFNQTDNKIYCANRSSDNVTVINGLTDSVITTIPVGDSPRALIYNAINNKVYCANYWGNTVTVIDGRTNQIITTIGVGDYPIAFTHNPQQNRTYVANYYRSSISVIRDFMSDVGVTQIISPAGMIDSGSVVIPRAVVKNFGTHQSSSFPAIFRIGDFYFDSQDVPELLPGDSIVVDFVSWNVSQVGIHPVKCSTALFRDQNSLNDAVIDTISVLREFDVGVVSILSPIGTVDSGTTVTPQVKVKNFGFTPADFPVWFKIYNTNNSVVRKSSSVSQFSTSLTGDNQTAIKQLGINQDKIKSQSAVDLQSGYNRFSNAKINSKDEKQKVDQIYEDVIWLMLEPGDSVIGEFQSWLPISPGEYYVESFTALPEDMNPLNDSLHDSIFVRTLDVSINRIITPAGIIDSGSVVMPQVVVNNFGNTEVSFPIIFNIGDFYTDTVNIPNLSPYDSTTINFRSWVVLERGTQISKCTTALIGDMNPINDVIRDSVIVRVMDVGVYSIIAPGGIIDSGSTVTPMVKVKNYGTTEASFPVWFKIQPNTENLAKSFKTTFSKTNQTKVVISYSKDTKFDAVLSPDQIYEDSVWLTLVPEDSIITVFDQWTSTIPDTYRSQSFTTFIEDMNPSNDSAYGSVIVRRPFHDVGVVNILAPTDTVDSGAIVIPRAVVQNFGTISELFPIRFNIGDFYTDDTLINLSIGLIDTVEFIPWTAIQVGMHSIKCTTLLTGDTNSFNDFLIDSVIVQPRPGIAEPANFQFLPKSFGLENCLSNPFKDRAIIRYALPKKSRINLCIYNSSGILVQTLKTGDEDIGYYRIIWKGEDNKGNKVAKGVYFYRLETDGFTSTKKMVKLE